MPNVLPTKDDIARDALLGRTRKVLAAQRSLEEAQRDRAFIARALLDDGASPQVVGEALGLDTDTDVRAYVDSLLV